MSPDAFKQQAAEHAADLVEPGMVVGLGVGSTAIHALNRIAARIRSGELPGVLAVPCSLAVENAALAAGIPLTTLEDHPYIDLTIDGADEIDPYLNLIKGGGGALLREKIVAQASRREIIVADASKLSPRLGERWPLPIEVLPFGWGAQAAFLESLGAAVVLRRNPDGSAYTTDQGNYVIDANFGPIDSPSFLATQLDARAGILAHGLFISLATDLILAGPQGLQHLTPPATSESGT
ncbi:MAG: ribose-5-phosphate isomerase RpiA [Anaerolineae bacterium]|nr:MAG: ribose-5-phosphate isomerase RpiA [Anaerolineae bacterium]